MELFLILVKDFLPLLLEFLSRTVTILMRYENWEEGKNLRFFLLLLRGTDIMFDNNRR